MSFYEVLGVPSTATQDQIKKQYRKLSLECHPDRPNGNSEKFKEINEAYENLSSDLKRKQYDASLQPMPDIFEMLFKGGGLFQGGLGGHFQQGGPMFQQGGPMFQSFMKPPPLVMNTTITLDQAYNGCNIPISIERWIQTRQIKQLQQETLYIDIPKGIDAHECILIEGKGNMGPDGELGDVRLSFTITNPTKMERKGLDLFYVHEISLKESLCGCSFSFLHLQGKTLTINSPKGNIISPLYKREVDNMGMKRGECTGKLIISVNIIFPETLDVSVLDKLLDIL
jgi:curved DNA-binding protein